MEENFLFDEINGDSFSLIAEVDENPEELSKEEERSDRAIPVMPLRNMVLFPGVFLPVSVGRKTTLKLVMDAYKSKTPIAVFCQKNEEVEEPGEDDLHRIGSLGRIIRVLELPDQSITAIVQGRRKIKLKHITETEPYLMGEVEVEPQEKMPRRDREFKALIDSCKELTVKYMKASEQIPPENIRAIRNMDDPRFLVNYICGNLPISKDEKIELLKLGSVKERAYKLLEILNREIQLAEIKLSIQMRAREDINQQQRQYFLQQQIKTIQDELGGSVQDRDVEELREKAEKTNWSKETQDYFLKELQKLERMHTQSPDYSIQLTFLQTLLSLPWAVYTKDNTNMANAERVLNKDHYGLEKVKERILEHLAVLKLKNNMDAPILCLYGPPGVGKTSLGKSIAAALKRKYIRMSLGGVHDEAEIRGHRRTYIGAMPGRIVKNLIKAGSANPVFVLDEVDKLGSSHQGDPAAALLEVLDPEQNNAFHDNYLDVDLDLSKVMFLATANSLSSIPEPLLDRMELIEVSGYITEEKLEIAKRHLLPKQLEACGMKKGDVKFSKKALERIIESYTRESGVRQLEKKIGKVLRKVAKEYATDEGVLPLSLQEADVERYLGMPEYVRDNYQGNDFAGVVTGLAWTAVGGEILFVESSLSRGREGKLTLTGNLGDVMKESALLALEYIKAHAEMLEIPPHVFTNWNVHLHVPQGAIPKDGPSAGITMATSLASLYTQRKVKPHLAMTGEITLRGKVLPVGGIKEKILAAKRAGIKEVILSKENEKNIREIPEMYVQGLTFHYVNEVREVFDLALMKEQVEHAMDWRLPAAEQNAEEKKA